MQHDEVIREALTNAPASAAPLDPPAADGDKVIRAAAVGDVDIPLITDWVGRNGGRAQQAVNPEAGEGAAEETFWVVPETALEL